MAISKIHRINGTLIAEGEGTIAALASEHRANLVGANLRGADLRGADLVGANLRGADLRGADLVGANLRGAYLVGANLRGAYLGDADLVGANLRGAYLGDADLGDADLVGANLRGANLRDATMPGGETWEQYLADVVPALLVAGGRPLAEVATEKAWVCHSWDNCPMAAAFGCDSIDGVPLLYRPRAVEFIQFFDARLIPRPEA